MAVTLYSVSRIVSQLGCIFESYLCISVLCIAPYALDLFLSFAAALAEGQAEAFFNELLSEKG